MREQALCNTNLHPENAEAKKSAINGPPLPGGQIILERPRVNALLEKALESMLVFVTAGEGCGKTCAIHSFLNREKTPVIWIPMTEQDNDPAQFWESVSRAVASHDPRAGKYLREIGFPESPEQINRILLALQDTGPARKRYIIVVDDCYLIREESIHNFVNQLMATPSPRETTFLIYRTEPKLNTVPLLSKGILSRISADDLRFTEEEVTEYFRLRNIDLDPGESQKICTDTEGWILAINIIADEMSGGNKKYSRSFLETGKFRSMEEASFASVPVQYQRFLVILSLFDKWPLEALKKITSTLPGKLPSLDEFTEVLNHLSLFIHYDTYLHSFKFHRFFLEFLREKQGDLSGKEIKTAFTLAAEWCIENDLLIDAARVFVKAADYGGIMRAIYTFPRFLPRPAAASFLEVIDRVIDDPQRDETDEKFWFLRLVTRPGLLVNLGRYDEARADVEKSIQELSPRPPDDTNNWILSALYNTLATISIITYRKTKDISKTAEYFRIADHYYTGKHPVPSADPAARANIGSYANPVGYPSGPEEFDNFIEAITHSIPYASHTLGGYLSGIDSLCRAELAFFRGELVAAEQHAREAIFKAREKGQYEIESKSIFYLLRIQLCNGDISGCGNTWDLMEAQLNISNYTNRYVIHDIMSGWFYAHGGETELISPWLRNEYEVSDFNLPSHNFEVMVKAKSLFAEKQYKEALKFLERKEVRESLGSFHLGMLEITVLEAAIRGRMGDETGALKSLEAAYIMSLSNSLVMPFVELGEDMRILAAIALNSGASGEGTIPRLWLETIRNKASGYSKKHTTLVEKYRSVFGDGEVPFLASQEVSILMGISQGLTREEIAGKHSLSVNTLKSIIKTIFDKLGAFNRADAIRKAANMGLLK